LSSNSTNRRSCHHSFQILDFLARSVKILLYLEHQTRVHFLTSQQEFHLIFKNTRFLTEQTNLDLPAKTLSTWFFAEQTRFVCSVKNLATVLDKNLERMMPRTSTSEQSYERVHESIENSATGTSHSQIRNIDFDMFIR
jgi:hypothetical protein